MQPSTPSRQPDRRAAPSPSRANDDYDRRRQQRRTPLHLLDQPLPEDVAFRPPAEGGDRTILPPRRRPPPGPHATRRVLLSGTRFAPRPGGLTEEESFDARTPEPTQNLRAIPAVSPMPAPATPPSSEESASASEESAGEGEPGRRRRRRGRRGGRGRRRGGDVASNGSTEGSSGAAPVAAGVDLDASDGELEDGAGQEEDDEPDPVSAVEVDEPLDARPVRTLRVDRQIPEAFRALGLGEACLASIAALGFEQPTPIQLQAIPALIDGHDVVGLAQTGSGKTLAFGAPLIENCNPALSEPQALVLVPTRELAQQVLDVLATLAAPLGLSAVGLLGGRALNRDFRALERGPQIVVGTPGRIIDHLHRGTLSLREVRYAVLDEADQMLDIGFLPDITRILGRTPRRRQTALFSATMPTSIKRLVHRYMREPVSVSVDAELTTVESVDQLYFEVADRDKLRGLSELVRRELKGRTLVFSKTRRGVDRLSDRLREAGIAAGPLHGDMDQRSRDRVVEAFRRGELDILVATNVAARGLDIPEITHVVNFDVPQNVEEYVHRIGRTGRMGRAGKAITFVSERDVAEFDVLLRTFADRLHKERLELYD